MGIAKGGRERRREEAGGAEEGGEGEGEYGQETASLHPWIESSIS